MPYKEQQGLNWRNDPLLFDSTPLPSDQWLTANDLIEKGQTAELFLWKDCLNLYPIMIRKIDFLGGERLLQSMPYIVLTDYWAKKLRKCSLALAERCFYYFAGSPAEYTIRTWQRKIIDYAENQKRIPFPIFRLMNDWEHFLKGDFLAFQSARGENFTMPLKLSEDLAYLLGIIAGDGHLNVHNTVIVDFSKAHIEMLQLMFSMPFGFKGQISGKEKTWLLFLNNKWLVRLVNFLTDQPITGKKYEKLREPLLLSKNKQLRITYWTGVLDADGSYKYAISFSTSTEQFRYDFCSFLNAFKISYSTRESWGEGAKSYSIDVPAAFRKRFAQLVKPKHPQKKQELKKLLEKTIATSPSAGKWPKQIIGFKKEKILPSGFFDFSCLEGISVLNAGKFIKQLRQLKNYHQTDFGPTIDQSLLSKYELNKIPIPIRDLKEVLVTLEQSNLMSFLAQNSLEFFIAKRAKARLDLQPNQRLLELLKGLQVKKNYFLLVGLPRIPKEQYRQMLVDYFNLEFPREQTASAPLYSSVLEKYVREFMIITS